MAGRSEVSPDVGTEVTTGVLSPSARSGWSLGRLDPRGAIVYVSLGLLFVVFSILLRNQGFLSQNNLFNIVLQAATIAVMACAYVFVLAAGEIDLSIGSTVALSAMVTAAALQSHGLLFGILAGLGTGLAVGAVNAALVTVAGIPSFLATLATLSIGQGLARSINNLQTLDVSSNAYDTIFGSGAVAGVSTLFIWMVLVAAVAWVAFHSARLGAHVRATGDNRKAAAAVGIRVRRIRASVLIFSSLAAALAGMLYAGRIQSASYTLGETDLLTVIAAVIIGGTSLSGGRGTIPGALAGSVLLAMLNNGLILAGLSVAQQSVALGIIIVLAVILGRDRQASS